MASILVTGSKMSWHYFCPSIFSLNMCIVSMLNNKCHQIWVKVDVISERKKNETLDYILSKWYHDAACQSQIIKSDIVNWSRFSVLRNSIKI